MAIKIDKDPSGILKQVANRTAPAAAEGLRKETDATARSAPSAVNLTRLTESIQRALQGGAVEASFDEQRVAELREAIAGGRYEVDLAATSRAILALEREIFE